MTHCVVIVLYLLIGNCQSCISKPTVASAVDIPHAQGILYTLLYYIKHCTVADIKPEARHVLEVSTKVWELIGVHLGVE